VHLLLGVITGRSLLQALAFVVLSVTSLGGCAASVRSAAIRAPRAAVPVVVDESLKALEDAANRERVERILETPEMRRAIGLAAASAARGALAGAEEDRKAILHAIDEVVASSTRTAVENVAATFPGTLVPVMREATVSTLSSPDVRTTLDGLTAEVTRTALLSSRDALREMHEEGELPLILTKLQRLLVGTVVAAFVLGALAAALVAWALRVRRRSRASDAATRELLGAAARATEGKAWSGEMLELLARQMNASQVHELRDLMKH
jgi:hypothetical protein